MEKMILTFIGVAIFIGICIWLALFYSKQTTNIDQYLVSGRTVGFWVLIGSWIGGVMGGSSVAGFMGYGWDWGVSRFFSILPAYLFLLIFVLLFAKKLSVLGAKYHLVSIPDFLALRYGNKIRIPGVLFIFFRMGFIVGLQIMALGLIFKTGFGMSLYAGMAIGTIVLVAYVAIGGMMASIVIEWLQSLLQSIVMIAICLVAMYIVGGGNIFAAYKIATETLPADYFNVFALPGNMILNYFLCMGFYYLADQWAFQRIFAASNPSVAYKSLTLGNVLAVFFVFLPFTSGIMMRAGAELGLISIPLDTPGASVFFYYVINILPTGVGVFFLVCYMAAVLSCGSAFLLGGAPLIVRDVYQSFINPKAEPGKLIKVGRIGVCIVAVFGVVGALWIPDLVVLWNMGNTFTACGLLVPVLAAFFWGRSTERGALASCWLGGLSALGFSLYSWKTTGDVMMGPGGIPVVVVGLIVSLVVMVVFSLTQKPDDKELVDITNYKKLSAVEFDSVHS